MGSGAFGGGTRGFAHIGVLKALERQKNISFPWKKSIDSLPMGLPESSRKWLL
jgi:hypothetical protein